MNTLKNTIQYVSNLDLPWKYLDNKTFLITGASGMIGSLLIHVLMERNEKIRIIGIGRNEAIARERFMKYWGHDNFTFISHDVCRPLTFDERTDYIIHAASNTHPIAYASRPIETITTNTLGTLNLLDYCYQCQCERFLFTSSVEVYGENRGDTRYFAEDYCGYINCNTLRAGYPESKRTGEALCQAYIKEKNIDAVIGRLARTYGPTMSSTDSKALAQFIKNGIAKKNIVLKSPGHQLYSYIYAADAVSGLLTILLKGNCGEAYNIADSASDITLKDLAQLIASYTGTIVDFELPDELESAGYSKATTALLDATKLQSLGWNPHWNIRTGIQETLDLLTTSQSICG